MLERDPRLCSELLWKELFLRPDELAGASRRPMSCSLVTDQAVLSGACKIINSSA